MIWTAGFRSAVISPYEQIQLTEPRGFADQTVLLRKESDIESIGLYVDFWPVRLIILGLLLQLP